MTIQYIPNHVEQALERMLFEYQNAELFNALMTAIVQPIQLLEDVVNEMETELGITTAFGAQLDGIGKLVGVVRRPGQTDASYLLSLYGQIGINRSDGLTEDVIQAFLVYIGVAGTTCGIYDFYPAAFEIVTNYVFPDPTTEAITANFIQTVCPVGVQFLGFSNVPPTVLFAFDGPQVGYKSDGFGDLNDPNVGGFWSGDLTPWT